MIWHTNRAFRRHTGASVPCAAEIIRGTSHRVIVVRSPDSRIFEQAIFIMRDDYTGSGGSSPGELLRQAKASAENSVTSLLPPRRHDILPYVTAAVSTLALIVLSVLRILGI